MGLCCGMHLQCVGITAAMHAPADGELGCCAAKKAAYDSYEQEIFEELSALVSDAGALHTFLEAALKLESSALLSSVGPGPVSILEVRHSLVWQPCFGSHWFVHQCRIPSIVASRAFLKAFLPLPVLALPWSGWRSFSVQA